MGLGVVVHARRAGSYSLYILHCKRRHAHDISLSCHSAPHIQGDSAGTDAAPSPRAADGVTGGSSSLTSSPALHGACQRVG